MSTQMIDMQKKNMARKLEDTDKELDRKYLDFGKWFFSALTVDDGKLIGDAKSVTESILDREEFKEYISEIKALKDTIKDVQQEIEMLNNIATCPKCGNIISEGELFCSNCGERLINELKDKDENVCPHCGKPRKSDGQFCVICGFKFEDNNESERRCISCGAVLPEDVIFCHVCGKKQ